jgi:hypothetical protein
MPKLHERSFWDILTDKAKEHIVAAIIAGAALALTAGAAVAWAAIKSWVVFDMPAGAVVAYDLRDRCPQGWSPFDAGNGRVIVGAGKGDSLTARPFGQPGGREQHTLTLQQMPAHSHSYVDWRSGPGSCTFSGCNGTGGDQSKTTGVAGGMEGGATQAFEIMPPYLALRLCKKD